MPSQALAIAIALSLVAAALRPARTAPATGAAHD